jgi:hypothetical protein
MSHTNSQSGVSILFIVLISSLILAVGLGLTALLIQEMRMMSEIGYSVTAFYAADSGIEAAIYDLYQSDLPTSAHSDESDNVDLGGAGYDTLAYCCHFSFIDKCSFGDPDAPEEEEERPICPLGIENIGSNDPNDPDYCNTINYCLKSTGSYQKVKRAIEIKY